MRCTQCHLCSNAARAFGDRTAPPTRIGCTNTHHARVAAMCTAPTRGSCQLSFTVVAAHIARLPVEPWMTLNARCTIDRSLRDVCVEVLYVCVWAFMLGIYVGVLCMYVCNVCMFGKCIYVMYVCRYVMHVGYVCRLCMYVCCVWYLCMISMYGMCVFCMLVPVSVVCVLL